MPPNNDEEVPVRSPIDIGTEEEVSPQDQDDFSTLLFIQKEFNREMRKLSSIDILEFEEGSNGLSIKEQVAAYKKAKEILEPLLATVNSRIQDIKGTQGGK